MSAPKSLNKVVLFIGGLAGAGGEERLLWEEENFYTNWDFSTASTAFNNTSSLFSIE